MLRKPVSHPFGGLFAVILPVIQTVVIGQCHVHIRRVADVGAVHPFPPGQRVKQTGIFASRLLRLVEAHEQQRQKGHIIAQSQPSQLSGLLPDPPTDAAINRTVALLLLLRQLPKACRYITKHGDPSFFEVFYQECVNSP